MDRMYTIEQTNPYYINVTEIKDIEDVSDVFYTEEEVIEILGNGFTYVHVGFTTFTNKVKERLNGYKQEMIKNGKRSIIIDDVELIEFFKEFNNDSVSDYVPGLRRVGNRLSIFEKKAKVGANKRDYARIINRGARVVSGINKLTIEFKYLESSQFEKALTIIKTLITWDQLVTGFTDVYGCYALTGD